MQRNSCHIIVSWDPSWQQWLKLNVDGSKIKNGQGIGFIVRDHLGKPFMEGGRQFIYPHIFRNLLREYQGKLIIEGDSMNALQRIQTKQGDITGDHHVWLNRSCLYYQALKECYFNAVTEKLMQ